MKKYLILFLALSLWACKGNVEKSPSEDEQEMIPLEEVLNPAESVVPMSDPCGQEIDPDTRERIPAIDLVITHVEVKELSGRIGILPTVKNLCQDKVVSDFNIVALPSGKRKGGATMEVRGLAGLAEYTGTVMLVDPAPYYVIIIDEEGAVKDRDRTNNSCKVSETGRCN